MPRKKKTNRDKLRAMVDGERLGATLALGILQEDWQDVREYVEPLSAVADAIESAAEAIESYQDAEGKEEKSDTRDEALSQIEALLAALDDLDEAPELPDLSETPFEMPDFSPVEAS